VSVSAEDFIFVAQATRLREARTPLFDTVF
jgi:hypothetical protein